MRRQTVRSLLVLVSLLAAAACGGGVYSEEAAGDPDGGGGGGTASPTLTPRAGETGEDPDDPDAGTPTPTATPPGDGNNGNGAYGMDLRGGDNFTCLLTSNGSVWCWGENCDGELGNGTWDDSSVPTAVLGLSSNVKAIRVGEDHTCALRKDGSVWCWGDGNEGQLGDGDWSDKNAPVQVANLAGVRDLWSGNDYACAVTSNGAAWCWGRNDEGKLGDGTNDDRAVPTAVLGLSSNAAMVRAWDDHTCAVKRDGKVLCWGDNGDGELGAGFESDDEETPVMVVGP